MPHHARHGCQVEDKREFGKFAVFRAKQLLGRDDDPPDDAPTMRPIELAYAQVDRAARADKQGGVAGSGGGRGGVRVRRLCWLRVCNRLTITTCSVSWVGLLYAGLRPVSSRR